jgi:DNA-binding transcriptional ArsR family regulator
MAKPIPDDELNALERLVRAHPGIDSPTLAAQLREGIPKRTLQHRLKRLVDDGRLVREGEGRWTRYRVPDAAVRTETADETAIVLSPTGEDIRAKVRRPPTARTPAGYDRGFLDAYRPGETFYLPAAARARLAEIGARHANAEQPAGSYARHILNRLLIDLSWNSSRLEGNTYSLLDTKRLIEFGQEAEGRDSSEAQMILNHKEAVEFLVENAADVGFNRYTILNLHGMLANNLLPDSRAAGRLRHFGVGIDGSVYHPPEGPQLIEECFDQLLATAAAIADPFEQSFFVMVHLPYLQPFDDVNKRVSRMAANIPFIRTNLSPLSFTDVPRDLYTHATLGVYELNRIELLRDVFVWAYERSAARYAAVRQSLGEPDRFRLQHRDALRAVVGEVVRTRLDRRAAAHHVAAWTDAHIEGTERAKFRDVAENDLLGLHEGNFARYGIRPAEFAAWRAAWGGRA